MQKKKMLYINHAYHNKTGSNQFLQDIFAIEYDITKFSFDPYTETFDKFDELKGQVFDVVILFQIMPSIKELNKHIKYKHINFFPMYDGTPDINYKWREYENVNIINFSSTLHQKCRFFGLSSYFIQYFPKPEEIKTLGDEKSAFLWQRRPEINIKTVDKTLGLENLNKLYLHRAPDPEVILDEIPKELENKVKVSTWFESKKDMDNLLQEAAIYYAPRMSEGIGMSFLDAMALGRCVIAPNHPTMNEYIKNWETGFLYNEKAIEKIEIKNIREIQNNTIEFIKQGYAKWEKEKFQILDWIITPPSKNSYPMHIKERLSQLKPPSKWEGYSFIQKLFSIKNSDDKTQKIITLLGIQIKIRKKHV